METRPVVLLVGDSVLMESVALCLRVKHMLDVVWLDPESVDITQCVKIVQPALIIFELDAPQTQSILSLLRDRPGTLLLGLDLACSRVIVMNSHQCVTHTMRDLYQVFQSEVSRNIRSSNGGTAYGQNRGLDVG